MGAGGRPPPETPPHPWYQQPSWVSGPWLEPPAPSAPHAGASRSRSRSRSRGDTGALSCVCGAEIHAGSLCLVAVGIERLLRARLVHVPQTPGRVAVIVPPRRGGNGSIAEGPLAHVPLQEGFGLCSHSPWTLPRVPREGRSCVLHPVVILGILSRGAWPCSWAPPSLLCPTPAPVVFLEGSGCRMQTDTQVDGLVLPAGAQLRGPGRTGPCEPQAQRRASLQQGGPVTTPRVLSSSFPALRLLVCGATKVPGGSWWRLNSTPRQAGGALAKCTDVIRLCCLSQDPSTPGSLELGWLTPPLSPVWLPAGQLITSPDAGKESGISGRLFYARRGPGPSAFMVSFGPPASLQEGIPTPVSSARSFSLRYLTNPQQL